MKRSRARAGAQHAVAGELPDLDDLEKLPTDTSVNDIEAQIAALEQQLGSSGSSDDSDSSDGDGRKRSASSRPKKLASKLLETDRIQPLPPELLPLPGCGVPKAKKRKAPEPQRQRGDGLESVVNELLSTYEARSAERIPFYCRVCKYQGVSVDDLARHRSTPLHEAATARERRVSFCKLCRKQFTSPPQLREHVAGRVHKERLEHMLAKQGKWAATAEGGDGGRADAGGASNGNGGGGGGRQQRQLGGHANGGGRHSQREQATSKVNGGVRDEAAEDREEVDQVCKQEHKRDKRRRAGSQDAGDGSDGHRGAAHGDVHEAGAQEQHSGTVTGKKKKERKKSSDRHKD